MTGSIAKTTRTMTLSLVTICSIICIASRYLLVAFPNIKPITAIIVLLAWKHDWKYAMKVALSTAIISSIGLGIGPWVVFQVLAWGAAAFVADKISQTKLGKSEKALFTTVVLAGFVFGFVVSLDTLILGGVQAFIPYYTAGLLFDVLHASGNALFYKPCKSLIEKIEE